MTIPSAVSRNDYVGNGATSVYPYTYKIFDEGDLLLTKVQDDLTTTLILNVDYTVDGVGDLGGGDITLSASHGNLANLANLSIRRVVDVVQETDIRNQGTYFPEVLEDALDRLVMIDLQQDDEIGRSLKLPEAEAGSEELTILPVLGDRLGKYLKFNEVTGAPEAVELVTSGVLSVSAFVETLLDDASAVAFRQTLLLDKKGADIASAATINLDSSTGDLVDVTGTTAITAITLSEGIEKTVRFTGALTLTHGASLVLPGAVNIITAAGDYAVFRGYAAGVVRLMSYQPSEQGIVSKLVTAAGDLLYATAARTLARRAIGTAGQILAVVTGAPNWQWINDFTEDTTPDNGADFLLSYDTSAGAHKKVLLHRVGKVLGTAVAATSGTSIDFTGIPSWVKKITVTLAGVSVSGVSDLLIQLGDSGGIENTGYLSGCSAAGTSVNSTAGLIISDGTAAATVHNGSITITLCDPATNTWASSGVLGLSNAANTYTSGGSKALSAALDRIRLTTVGGAVTFDAGTVNILME